MKTSGKIAIAVAAVGAWLIAKKKGVISNIGKVDYSDFDGARIIAKDGLHAISFDIYGRGENGITVTAEMKGSGDRYGFSWEYLSHIGEYKTLSGAIKAASKYAMMHNWVFDSDDFEKL